MMRKVAILLVVVVLGSQAVMQAASRTLPTPESVLGFKPGADNKLATYDQAISYLKKLAAASPSIRLVEAGKTTDGRVMYFALISNAKNLDNVDRYREIAQRLAHPQGLSDDEARRLAREGKAFVHLDGGCHATEVAGAQMTLQLAYDLLNRAAEPAIKDILDNDILMLWPTMNPDGQQMVGEWLAKNAGTPYEQSGLPRLYQEYVGHDNNRDAYMLNMIESRVMEQFWRQWEPNIIYVFHQSAPFPTRIWLPPFSEPIALDAPYVVSREINMIGMAIAKSLDERGQVGATHMGQAFDAWYPGYVDYAPVFKNIPAFWTETAGNMAAPREYTLNDLPESYRDLRPQSLYASPWPGGWWRLGDAVAYNETAAISTLEFAAKYRESLLYNRYQAGRDQIAAGRKTAPYAYMIPQDQRDPVAAVEMLRRLAFGGVRVSQLTSPATIDKVTYAAGTWVVPTDQEFGAMARELLNPQKYPDLRQYPGGPPVRPYDAAGWTLPLQMGVKVTAVASPLAEDVRGKLKLLGATPLPTAKPTPYNMTASADPAPFDSVPGIGFDSSPSAAAIIPPAGRLSGSGPALAVDPAQNNAFRAITRAWKLGASVQFAAGARAAGARYIITGLPDAAQADLVKSLALVAERTSASGVAMKKPRIGLYQPWTGSMDEGWTRWLLEQYGFEFVSLHPEDFKTPLRDKVDSIILADDARIPVESGGQAAVARGAAGTAAAPPAGARAAGAAPAAGRGQGGRGGGSGRAVRPEYAYALTAADLQAFETFVRDGGTVVCFNSACRFAIQQFKLPVRNVAEGLKPEEFFLRGSIVNVQTDPTHPVMAGMDETSAVFVDGSPVYEPQVGFKGTILAKYADTGSPLQSGYLIGEKYLQGKAAALDVELDKGHVVLLGFRPQWRGQPFATFRVVFNSAIYVR
ncbi:MAG: M14 family metallopeptidase [Acidobacteria bacterium]|nr:M14 family metallopeptidase [Acidobacteriota bacterium]